MKLIRFIKTKSKADLVEYESDAKIVMRLENPKQGIIPHDLVHAVVESVLEVRGFTDLIFSGQKPELAMKVDGEAWLSESMVESIQGMLWSGELSYEQFNSWVAAICAQRNVPAWNVSAEKFFELKSRLDEISEEWNSLRPDTALIFVWPQRPMATRPLPTLMVQRATDQDID